MPEAEPKKIVYLFGAGATHAELQSLDPDLIPEKQGLLINNVSSRVIEKARREKKYTHDVEMVSGTKGSLNIELLISLLENSKIHDWEYRLFADTQARVQLKFELTLAAAGVAVL
jgi:hypothetical protein